MKRKAMEAMIEMGLPANFKGFRYITEIIGMYEEDDAWILGKLTLLYEVVGKKVGTSGANVERCVRRAFEWMQVKGRLQKVEKYIGVEQKTNGSLLAAFYIRLQEE